MSEEGFQPKHGGIEIVNPNDRGLPDDLRFSAMANKTLANEVRKIALKFAMGSDEFGVLYETHERLKSRG